MFDDQNKNGQQPPFEWHSSRKTNIKPDLRIVCAPKIIVRQLFHNHRSHVSSLPHPQKIPDTVHIQLLLLLALQRL